MKIPLLSFSQEHPRKIACGTAHTVFIFPVCSYFFNMVLLLLFAFKISLEVIFWQVIMSIR